MDQLKQELREAISQALKDSETATDAEPLTRCLCYLELVSLLQQHLEAQR